MQRLAPVIFACLMGMAVMVRAARADVREHATALVHAGATAGRAAADRSAGTPAAAKNADYLVQQARQATTGSGAQVFRQAFLMTVPVVDICRVTVAVAMPAPASTQITTTAPTERVNVPRVLPVAPLLPMGGQPPVLGTSGGAPRQLQVIYGHTGQLADLKGKDVAGRLVALEIDAPEGPAAWQRCASLGAAAIVFLGNTSTAATDLLNKSTTLPLAIPRLYCDDPDAVAWFRKATGGETVAAELHVHWEERTVENVICVIPGSGGRAGSPGSADNGAAADWVNQWVILQSRYDGVSQVMTRAPGATPAANAGVLLDLAGQIAKTPSHCGAVLVWTAGDEWNYRGTRAFLDLVHRGLRDPAEAGLRLQQMQSDAAQQLSDASAITTAAKAIAEAGWNPAAPPPAPAREAIEEELLRESSRIEEQLQRERLEPQATAAEIARRTQLKQPLRFAINRINGQSSAPPAPAENAAIEQAARQVALRWEAEERRRRTQVQALHNWPEIRAAMGPHDPLIFIALALTAGRDPFPGEPAPSFGLLSKSAYSTGLDITGRMAPFAQAFRRYAENPAAGTAARPTAGRFAVDSLGSRFTLESLFPVKLGFASDAAIARGLPAFAAATLRDATLYFDTPNDTLDHIAWPQIQAQALSLTRLLVGTPPDAAKIGIGPGTPAAPGALTDPLFYGRTNLPVLVADQPITLYERALGETLPRLKAADTLIGGESEIYRHPLGDPLAGTRRTDWYLTHADGTATFTSAMRVLEAEVRLQAFQFDDAGNVRRALAANQSDVRGMVASFFPKADTPVRAMLFDCQRLDAYGLFDPRFLDTLEQIQVLDARRLDTAQFSNVYARQGLAAVFLPPVDEARWQLLASRGNVNNRMLLINADPQHPTGQGFDTTDLAKIGPLARRAARDFSILDAKRKADLERFGISNEVIRELQTESEKQMALATTAQGRNDYPAFLGAADAVWSLQSQEYQNLIDTSNGIIKGVIFLLLGVIPFSYFLERLVVGAVNVYHQIGWFTVIFALMTAGLWFHPAFRISAAPLMILLAFLILILSSTVVYILWGKFDEEISRIRGSGGSAGGGGAGGQAHVASFRRGAVLGAAIRLGLSNMRRRGMRTALTLTTLVLLTFTLLCFTSVRESVQVTPHEVSAFASGAGDPHAPAVPPAGILLRQRGWQQLPVETLELARGLALPPAIVLATTTAPPDAAPTGPIARRYWYASEHAEQPWLIPAQAGSKTYNLNGLIGLDPAEAQFQGSATQSLDALLPAFSASEPSPPAGAQLPRCWLPANARETLAIKEGDPITLLGYRLQVAGFFDPQTFNQLRQLTGDPLSPLDPGGTQSSSTNSGSGEATSEQALRPEASYRFLDSVSVAIVPAWLTEQLGGRLTSVMFRPAGIAAAPTAEGAATINAVATSLARRSAFTVYVSDARRVLSINAAEAARPRDLGTVLVPMLIAGIIVLNTMLGAVAERSREIHVYTSVGLSPAHVGMLFLAEAAALGTLGVVFGYIFGQGLATMLSWTHWLPGVDLNYSSMSAIITMGLVLGIVMLSALWPARSAARLATPSLQRDWKLPRPVGDLLSVDLPFTVNETAARGVCAFLAEFFITTSTSGTGRFTADAIQGFTQSTTQGPVRGLSARIWLAPYDLGVIQSMQLSIHPAEPLSGPAHPGVYDVHVQLTREAGNPSAWRRLNRPFLVEIRKQFLLWRALDPARIADYVARSETLFRPVASENI